MSCDDLDRLRTTSPGSHSSAWPREVQQHLASCEHCSRLQAALDQSSVPDLPEALQRRIEAAIIPGLRPVAPAWSVWRVTLALLLCTIVVIAVANGRLGIAGWRARNALQASIIFSLLGISTLVCANALAHQMMPGSRRRVPVPLSIVVPILALLAADVAMFGYRWNPHFVPLALSCWEKGVTCAALSAPLYWLVLRRGFFLHPIALGGTAGLMAGLTGMTVLEIYCPYLDRLHISASHIGAAVTATLVGAALGGIKSVIEHRVILVSPQQ